MGHSLTNDFGVPFITVRGMQSAFPTAVSDGTKLPETGRVLQDFASGREAFEVASHPIAARFKTDFSPV